MVSPVEGTPFGRYRLIELLGRGGMGEVWRAHDTATDRVVAIKVLPANLSEDEEFQRRFRREAHAAARLETPHVVPIHDYGEIDGRLFVCMRLIKGRDLAAVLADGPLEPARAVRIIGQVAEALHAAHEIGLIHRDIKPSNILLDDRDFAYLIDFGISRIADDTRMTKTGSTIGTFAYIAPERLDGQGEEDARVDIYSLACVLYECLAGEPPFGGDTMARLMYAHVNNPPPRPSIARPDVPAAVDEVIATGMAKDPDQRYATTVELADAAHDAITTPLAPPTNPTPLDNAPPPAPGPTHLDDRVRSMQPPAPDAVWQPAGEPTQPATHQRLPGWAPVPEARLADRTPPDTGTPPRQPWWRRGAIVIPAALVTVAVIAAAIVFTGQQHTNSSGPHSTLPTSTEHREPAYGPQVTLPFTGLDHPNGVAVDAASNLYVIDYDNEQVLKLAAGSTTQTVLPFTGLFGPYGVAVDSAGDLYVVDDGNARVLKLAAGSATQAVLPFTGLGSPTTYGPSGVAVDAAGDIYVTYGYSNGRVVKLAAGSATQSVLPFAGLNDPQGVAVDAAGNLYVADIGNNRVLKLAAGSATQAVLPFTGLHGPWGVAVDTAGNLYITDCYNNRVLELAAGSSAPSVLPFTGLNAPEWVAVDAVGNLYVTDTGNNRVVKLAAG
jgi:serine/threonine protein kinase, bacterial